MFVVGKKSKEVEGKPPGIRTDWSRGLLSKMEYFAKIYGKKEGVNKNFRRSPNLSSNVFVERQGLFQNECTTDSLATGRNENKVMGGEKDKKKP